MRHRPRHVLAAAALLALPAPLFSQTTATWLSPTSGSWTVGSNWSTNVPPGSGTSALIAATGSPYTVTAPNLINPARLDLTSPDATLDLLSGANNTTLNLAAGTAILHGSFLSNVAIRGTAPLTVDTSSASFTNLTLASTLRGIPQTGTAQVFKYLDFYNSLTLDGGTLSTSASLSPVFHDTFTVTGTGTIAAEPRYTYAQLAGNGTRNLILGPGVTLTAAADGAHFNLDSGGTSPLLTNNGTISASAPDASISIGSSVYSGGARLSVVNNGTLAASNGGTLFAALPAGGTPGNLSLGTGGTLSFTGPDYSFTQPFTVPATTRLQLDGTWKVTAPLTVDAGGTLTIASAPTASANIQYASGSTVQLINTISAASLPLLNTTPSTTLSLAGRLDLGGSSFSLASVPGQWTYGPRLFAEIGGAAGDGFRAIIQNGTLSAGAAGNDLLPNGGAVKLSTVTVNFPLSLDHGTVYAQNTTFAQPVSLSGTGRLILSTLSSTAGLTATGGTLELPSLPTSPGTITMSGDSTLQLNFSTTLAQVSSLPYGSPGTVAAGPRGVLDLQSAAVDLSTSPFQLALSGATNSATLRNGTITDPSHSHAIRVYPSIPGGSAGSYRNSFANLSCSADVIIDPLATLNLFNSSLHDAHISGGGTLTYSTTTASQTTTLDHITLDGVPLHVYSNSPLTITNGLTTNAPLTIDPGSTVDLTTSTLLLTNPDGPSPLTTIRTYLLDARLTSSSSDATHRLAYLYSGEPTAPASVLVKLTLTGDTNLDGHIDGDDYTLLDRAYARSTTNAHWTDGDFNYDGTINQQDYLLLDTAYAQSHPLSPSLLSQRESQFGPDYVSQLLTSIPEPSSLACLLAPSLLLTRRRTKS